MCLPDSPNTNPPPDAPTVCCHLQHGSLIFLCPISGDLDPLYALAFICAFLDILVEYFGQVTAPTLRDNFDTVHQLLEETLDAGGHPLTTSPNALREIVLPPSLITKVLSVTGVSGPTGPITNSMGTFASSIPWRWAGVRSGSIVTSSVLGKICVNCKSSGTPDVLPTLTNVHTITEPFFHPCVRLNRFSQSKALSFVPPDGHFTLMEYRFGPSASKPGTFELMFIPRPSALDDVAVEFYLSAGASSATCSQATGGSEWTYVPARRTLRWSLPPAAAQSSGGRGASAAATMTLQAVTMMTTAAATVATARRQQQERQRQVGGSKLFIPYSVS
ncbi:Mu homology domain-containing protein [Lactifluus subvellereus]|nr:Mu homology domain-containing protein [Lactifluus subvellereus]